MSAKVGTARREPCWPELHPDLQDSTACALRRLMPRLDIMGITRLADITGLDRIGIPVVQAVRPLGLANAVTQGKGPSRTAAAVSAIMEAAEQFFAERIERFCTTSASALELGIRPDLFARHLLPDAPGNWGSLETAWVEALDLLTGRPSWVPMELVHTAYVEPAIPSDGLFSASTTGLACAFSKDRAITHALLECIERDAVAKAQRTHGFFQKYRINPATISGSDLLELIDIVRGAGLVTAFWAVPAAAGIPVVWCQIMEEGSCPLITPYPADGFAADLDPASAARRALLEAAQSRLAAISGARDDMTRAAFPARDDWAAIEAHRRLFSEGPRPLAFAALGGEAEATDAAPLGRLLCRLVDQQVSVLHIQLETEPCHEIAAVRIVTPELWPLSEA
jgi:YcaO-like protein with predicted kinase domain